MSLTASRFKRIACRNCRHYLLTWDVHLPYGCRAHGFKSAKSPAWSVYEASGMECLLYQPKTAIPRSFPEPER